MAINDISDYCSSASELVGSCNQTLAMARGFNIFISYVQEYALFILFFFAIGSLIVWSLSSAAK